MKTDQLIDVLSTNLEPVDRGSLHRTLRAALGVGTAAAFALTFLVLGVRPDLHQAEAVGFLALKLTVTLGVTAMAAAYLHKLTCPGGERKTQLVYAGLPLFGVWVFALFALAFSPSTHWHEMIVGDHWRQCLVAIPLTAIAPFAVIVWAMRRGAPTDLTRAGAVAGLLAGAIGASAYSFHCTDDSLPFIAVWYGGTIAICTLAGAKLGPRLLRW